MKLTIEYYDRQKGKVRQQIDTDTIRVFVPGDKTTMVAVGPEAVTAYENDANGKRLFFHAYEDLAVDQRRKLEEARRIAMEHFYSNSDLNGIQVEDAGGWSHTTSDDSYRRTIFAESMMKGDPTIRMVLVVVFKKGTADIDYATLDGDDVHGSHNWKVPSP